MIIDLRWAAENAVWNSDIKPTMTIILWTEEPMFIYAVFSFAENRN